jgi:uncharacterized membrane protein
MLMNFLSLDPFLFLPLRMIHILSATLLFGTGLGTAFHGLLAYRTRDPKVMAAVGRSVVWADWLFTTPAVIVQPITGVFLVAMGGHDFTAGWVLLGSALYVFTGLCWLPVVWLQIRIRRIAEACVQSGEPLPLRVFTYVRLWFILGWPAFIAVIGIFYLMIFRPEF